MSAMTKAGKTRAAEIHRREMLGDLQRLVEALDRRVPRLERVGEAKIAADAADLRQRAIALIATLTRDASPPIAAPDARQEALAGPKAR